APSGAAGAPGSQVSVHVSVLAGPRAAGPGGAVGSAQRGAEEGAQLTLVVEVPGYGVEEAPFHQLLLNSSGRAALLVAPRCCAAFVVPELDAVASDTGRAHVSAVPLAPSDAPRDASRSTDVRFVKLLWHPLSDLHVGALLSDGTWQLLDLSRRATAACPEVQFEVAFGGSAEPGEGVADFAFGALAGGPGAPAGAVGDLWPCMAVVFLSTRGRMCFRSPVLPAQAHLPGGSREQVLGALSREGPGDVEAQAYACEALRQQGGPAVAPPAPPPEAGVPVRHRLHMHGDARAYAQRWTPAEQVLVEERDETPGDQTPRSPRHRGGDYCSVHVVAHSPAAVLARATVTGLVEIVILSGGLSPKFQPRGARASCAEKSETSFATFDEIDLALGTTKMPMVCLSGAPPLQGDDSEGAAPVVLARSRGLVAAIELPWVGVLQHGAGAQVESLPAASVATVSEVKPGDGGRGEIAGWQLLPGASGALGLSLHVGDAGAPAAQHADVWAALRAMGTATARPRAPKPPGGAGAPRGGACDAPGREEYLRHLAAPDLLPRAQGAGGLRFFGAGAGGDSQEAPAASAVLEAVAEAHKGQIASLEGRQLVLEHLAGRLPVRAEGLKAEVAQLKKMSDELDEASRQSERKLRTILDEQEKLKEQHDELVSALRAELECRELGGLAAAELPRLWSHLHDLRQARAAAALPPRWTDTSAGDLRRAAARAEAAAAALAERAERARAGHA
ncbi:unnamed protein product, partial [Prorocentrum cordatum]